MEPLKRQFMTYFLSTEQATTAGCVSSQTLAWLAFRVNSLLAKIKDTSRAPPLVVDDSTAPQGGAATAPGSALSRRCHRFLPAWPSLRS